MDGETTATVVAFLPAAGALVGAALLVHGGTETPLLRRLTEVSLVALPLGSFAFAALALDAELDISVTPESRPGVVESWALVAVAVACAAFVYGPMVGLAEGYATVGLGVLVIGSYLVGPVWLGQRVLAGRTATDVALLAVLLSVLVLVVGMGLGMAAGSTPAADARLLGGLGAVGTCAVTCWAAL